jgi:hypothetical protein
MTEKETPFACDMTAIAADQRNSHVATIRELFSLVESVRELPNGYGFQLPNTSDALLTAASFISLERLCCPFFGFVLEIPREGGPIWLNVTGRSGVKPFIIAEIGDHLPAGVGSS